MWYWSQNKGELKHNEQYCGVGYSGRGVGCNDANYQQVKSVGPIPQGLYDITQLLQETSSHGPFVLVLAPAAKTDTFGRSDFRIHGDNFHVNHSASEGCIVVARALREAIWSSGDREITVTA